jgi:hypothetical protein
MAVNSIGLPSVGDREVTRETIVQREITKYECRYNTLKYVFLITYAMSDYYRSFKLTPWSKAHAEWIF